MKKQKKLHTHWCLLGGIALAIVYWASETFLHTKIFHDGDFSSELLPVDNVHELWLRLLIVTMLVIFGIVMDFMLAKLRSANRNSARLVDELKKSLAEVKTLSGLLPICMECKKVKDNSGYWHQVEAYVRDHSDAKFSHGYCPDCAGKAIRKLDEADNTDEKSIQSTDSGGK